MMQTNKFLICLVCLVCLITGFQCAEMLPAREIEKVTDQMEKVWLAGRKADVATYYDDDACIVNPDGIVAQGRKEVDAYWSEFSAEPVDWKLSSFLITRNPGDIFESPQYREGSRKMTLWTDLDIQFPRDPVYQYGRSDLTYEKDGDTITSTVEFIIVWKKTPEGWRVLVDTYR